MRRPSIRLGPEHRAIPASKFPAFTHRANQRILQSQYHGLAPKPLQKNRKIQITVN